MLKKTVTFANVDGDMTTKDLYFNISSNELLEKEALSDQKYSERLQNIANSDKLSDIYPTVMEFLEEGYGLRTEDGDFEKSPEAWGKFKNSLAYHALMEELLFNPENNGNRLAEFINGMLPANLVAHAKELRATPGFRPGADISRPTPPFVGEPATPVIPTVETTAVSSNPEPQPVQSVESGVIQQTAEPRHPEFPQQ